MSSNNTWALDPNHSEIQFKIRHLMISTVTGSFGTFEGAFTADQNNFSTAKARIQVDVNSIHTNNEQRDAHLRNGDFFDAGVYPHIIFESRQVEHISGENYKVHGMLTMKGVSKEITFDAELSGAITDPWGNERMGLSASGTVSRKDFGITFGLLTDTGGVGLGEEVKFLVNAQFVKQAQPAEALAQ